MNRTDERRLIELAILGDRSAAGQLIKAHQASLYAYMLRISGRADIAEDIVQDAFVRALTNLHRFDFNFRFSTWLFTIAKRLYVNACQKLKPTFDSEIVGSVGSSAIWNSGSGSPARCDPEDPTIDAEISVNVRSAIDFALNHLSEDQREIVVLFHQLDWPIWQIAEYMDMPEGTVKSHLHRGRMKMREILTNHAQHLAHVKESLT